jgi:hypothetical protein
MTPNPDRIIGIAQLSGTKYTNMTPELIKLHESPPTEEAVLAEIGRTLLLIQPTEPLFNFIADAVIPDLPFTEEGLKGLSIGKQTFGVVKSRLEKKGINFDPVFLGALDKFINDRNKFVHRVHDIPGWNLKTPEGRIKAFCFLKFLQTRNIELRQVLLGLLMEYDKKHLYGVFGKTLKEHGLWPQAPFYHQVAKEVFGQNKCAK